MRPYFMCKPRDCRQEMQSGYKKKNLVVTSFMLREFSKLILSTQSRGHHRVNIVNCFSFNVVYASQFGIEFNDISFHSEYYIRTAMSLFQTTLKWP